MLEPIPFAGYVEIDNDKSLVEQAPYHSGYEDAGFEPTKLRELTDEEIYKIANEIEAIQPNHGLRLSNDLNVMDFARAILRKAQEK